MMITWSIIIVLYNYRDELDNIETSPNKAYGTTHHQVTTPTDECQYEDLNMCTS